MKKIGLILIVLTTLVLTSCVKQKNCDCGLSGKFIYYDPPVYDFYCGYERLINAYFYTPEHGYCIVGSIPKEFRTKDTLNVSVCLKKEKQHGCLAFGLGEIFNLTCIERED